MWNTTEKKSFVKYFLSWDCESEFVGSKADFKIIKDKNINEQNEKLSKKNKHKKLNWDWNSSQHSSKNRNSCEVNLFSHWVC